MVKCNFVVFSYGLTQISFHLQVDDDFQQPKELPFASFSSPKPGAVLEVST